MNTEQLFNKKILEYKSEIFIDEFSTDFDHYVNLDNAATTPPLKIVEKKVRAFLVSYGSVHRGSGEKSIVSTDKYEWARNTILKCVGAPEESYVVYSQNTTGAVNIIASLMAQIEGKIAVSDIEHSSSFLPFVVEEGRIRCQEQIHHNNFDAEAKQRMDDIQSLGKNQVCFYHIDDHGNVDLDDLKKVLTEHHIKAVMLTASANLTGIRTNIKAVSELVHSFKNTYLIVDACQYIPHHEVNMVELGIDFLVASGHKFYAPYGGGFLVGSKEFFDSFMPYQIGGGNLPYIDLQGNFYREFNNQAFDPGTPNSVGAYSMAVALKFLKKTLGYSSIEQYEHNLALYAYKKLKEIPEVKLYVSEEDLGSTLTFTVKGLPADWVAEELDCIYGIGVRAGAFCVYRYVNRLVGITDDKDIVEDVKHGYKDNIAGVIRASIGLQNTMQDMILFVEAIKGIIAKHQSSGCLKKPKLSVQGSINDSVF